MTRSTIYEQHLKRFFSIVVPPVGCSCWEDCSIRGVSASVSFFQVAKRRWTYCSLIDMAIQEFLKYSDCIGIKKKDFVIQKDCFNCLFARQKRKPSMAYTPARKRIWHLKVYHMLKYCHSVLKISPTSPWNCGCLGGERTRNLGKREAKMLSLFHRGSKLYIM